MQAFKTLSFRLYLADQIEILHPNPQRSLCNLDFENLALGDVSSWFKRIGRMWKVDLKQKILTWRKPAVKTSVGNLWIRRLLHNHPAGRTGIWWKQETKISVVDLPSSDKVNTATLMAHWNMMETRNKDIRDWFTFTRQSEHSNPDGALEYDGNKKQRSPWLIYLHTTKWTQQPWWRARIWWKQEAKISVIDLPSHDRVSTASKAHSFRNAISNWEQGICRQIPRNLSPDRIVLFSP